MNKPDKMVAVICSLLLIFTLACSVVTITLPPVTPQPSSTVPLPTATLDPSAPPQGWVEFSGDSISIWLPGTFTYANPETDLELVMNSIANSAPVMASHIMDTPDEFPFNFEFVAVDFAAASEYPPTVIVYMSSVSAYEDYAIQSFNDLANSTDSDLYEFVEQEFITVSGYDAFRRIIHETINGVECSSAIYVIREDRAVWAFKFTTSSADFDNWLADFDQSIQTFTAFPH